MNSQRPSFHTASTRQRTHINDRVLKGMLSMRCHDRRHQNCARLNASSPQQLFTSCRQLHGTSRYSQSLSRNGGADFAVDRMIHGAQRA